MQGKKVSSQQHSKTLVITGEQLLVFHVPLPPGGYGRGEGSGYDTEELGHTSQAL